MPWTPLPRACACALRTQRRLLMGGWTTGISGLSVQFHPEAAAGPLDTGWIFRPFADLMGGKGCLRTRYQKVLLIGSGPDLSMARRQEFDYAGTQACCILKQEGLQVVLVNSNPATIMTDGAMADHIYIEPLDLGYRN